MTLVTALLTAAVLGAGCHLLPPAPRPPGAVAATTRVNTYSLLYQLLSEDKDVKYLDLIKHENPPLKNLMKRIAATCAQGADLLDELAKHDPSIRLDAVDLPSGEVATRKAIADFKQAQLLKDKDNNLDLALLMSQAEALNYGWHLSVVAGEVENHPPQRKALNDLSSDLKKLYYEVFAMMLSEERAPVRP